MKKKILLLPVMLLLATSCSNSYSKVSASVSGGIISDGRYFIINDDNTYGLKESASEVDNSEQYSSLSIPFTFTHLGDNGYTISSGDKYLFRAKGGSTKNILFATSIEGSNNVWTITANGNYYQLSCNNNSDTRTLNYVSDTNYFDARKTSFTAPDIRLLSLEDSVTDFVTAMRNISCTDLVNGPSISEWNNAKSEYQKITDTPVINFLRTASFNKDAADTTIDWALSKYNYIIQKYGDSKYEKFITGRTIVPVDDMRFTVNTVDNSDGGLTSIIIITSISVLLTVSVMTFLKKKKEIK